MQPVKLLLFTFFFFFFCSYTLKAQMSNRSELIRIQLENLEDDVPQLKNKVSFSVADISLYEFIRALGKDNKVNIDVASALSMPIAINFTSVSVSDLLIYLCDQYSLDLAVTGNIITISKYFPPPVAELPLPPKNLQITYDPALHVLSYDLQADTLSVAVKKITELSGNNIIIPLGLMSMPVSGFGKNVTVEEALQHLAYSNNLNFRKKDSVTFYIEEPGAKPVANNNSIPSLPSGLNLRTNNKDSILSISAGNIPIKDVLMAVANQFKINYFIFSEIKGNTNLKAENIDFTTFLKHLFNSTDYAFRFNNGIYLIGERKMEEIRSAEVYPLQYRTVSHLMEQIPADYKKDLELIPLVEMNSLVMSGSEPAIANLKNFLRQIDKVVPVVSIELIILDVRKSHSLSTGLMAGIDKTKANSSYSSLFPTVDVTLSANSINSIINGINGTGLVNLGNVTPGFYVSLKASEDNGYLKIKSTPRLSTINGGEAEMKIGETRYYTEQTTNVITTQSTTTVSARIFKELQANFTVNIKPIVSGDEQITLDIVVDQSTFTEQFTKDGPYGRLTRSFKSSVRVRNNDVVLLGGLDERNATDAGQGIPFLSRIPVVKWLFSSRSNSNKKSKLAILIHPTVFY